MLTFKQTLALLIIAVIPLAACETAEEDVSIGDAQTDTTQFGDQQDVESGTFADWDANQDARLDQSEFGEVGYFDTWDADGDSELTSAEFEQGVGDAGIFNEWDADGDGYLNSEEFGYDNENWFSDWDAGGDQQLAEDEFAEGAFNRFDENADDALDQDEFLGLWDFDESGSIEEREFRDARERLGLNTETETQS